MWQMEVDGSYHLKEDMLQLRGMDWALSLPSKNAYEKFCLEYEEKAFENLTGLAPMHQAEV